MSVKRDNVFILELTALVCLYVFIWIVWGRLVEIMGVGADNASLSQPPLRILNDYFFEVKEPPQVQEDPWSPV